MEGVRRFAARAARVDAPVLLEGETGTGKSHLARLIHARSSRIDGRFVSVNCAGVPESLFESEFFGHRRGAFTGAGESRAGFFEEASGGSLFLDEVGELPTTQQAKLLTALEEGLVRRIGEARERQVDVRVVAATVQDLQEGVRSRSFRRDLYHRLALLRFRLPPLRDRPEDIASLADRFLATIGPRHGHDSVELTPSARDLLRGHDWPGNVRELAHALEAALILFGKGRLGRAELEEVLHRAPPACPAPSPGGDAGGVRSVPPRSGDAAPGSSLPKSAVDGLSAARDVSDLSAAGDTRGLSGASDTTGLPAARDETGLSGGVGTTGRITASGGRYSFYGTDQEEKEMIQAALERHRGNRTRAARELGMARNTLRAKIDKYAIG